MLYEYIFRYNTNAQSGENMRIFKSYLQLTTMTVQNLKLTIKNLKKCFLYLTKRKTP